MIEFLVHLVVTAVLLMLVGALLDSVRVENFRAALLGALVLGVANALVRPILVALTFPITFLTLGLFLLVVNAIVFALAAAIVPGFSVRGFAGAFWGALLLSVLNLVVSRLFFW